MAIVNNKKVYRVTLDFSTKSEKHIKKLQRQTCSSTKAEVFKQALNVFDFIITELSKGNKILVESNGETKEVLFPIMLARKS